MNYFDKNFTTEPINSLPRPDFVPETIIFDKINYNTLYPCFNEKPREGFKLWVLKPYLNSGSGFVKNFQELHSLLGDNNRWILQSYVDDPLLLGGKKMELRVRAKVKREGDKTIIYMKRRGDIYLSEKEYQKGSYENLKTEVLGGEFPEDFWKEYGKQIWDKKVFPQIIKIIRETIKLEEQVLEYQILLNQDFKCFLINKKTIKPEENEESYEKIYLEKDEKIKEQFGGMNINENFEVFIKPDTTFKKGLFIIIPLLFFLLSILWILR